MKQDPVLQLLLRYIQFELPHSRRSIPDPTVRHYFDLRHALSTRRVVILVRTPNESG